MNTWSFVGQNLAGKVITCACMCPLVGQNLAGKFITCACMYPFVGQNLAGKVRLVCVHFVLQTSGITGIPSLRNLSEHVKNTIHWFGIHYCRVSQTVTSQSEHVKSTIHWFGMY